MTHTSPKSSLSDYAHMKASKYQESELLEMLQGGDIEEIHEALEAIFTRKLKSALPYLKTMALYDEDIAIQREAIITIRRIGGRRALDVIRYLKTTEHRDFIEEELDL